MSHATGHSLGVTGRFSAGGADLTTTLKAPSDSLAGIGTDHPPAGQQDACEHWPIGLVVAVHHVAHGYGPQPTPPDVVEAWRLGLIELSDSWRATHRGQAILAEHGWLSAVA
jgi:hypothetical protein